MCAATSRNTHTFIMCPDGRPTSPEREKRQASDPLPPDATVIADARGSANHGYAYHLIGDDGTPLCRPMRETFEEMTVEEAHRRNKSPCGRCRNMRES